MWKGVGILILMLLMVVPGAIIGAFVGAIMLPAKVWALIGDYETSDVQTHNDEI